MADFLRGSIFLICGAVDWGEGKGGVSESLPQSQGARAGHTGSKSTSSSSSTVPSKRLPTIGMAGVTVT